MKKRIVFLLVLAAMVVSLAAGMGLSASADSINNTIKGKGSAAAAEKSPDEDIMALLKKCGVEQMPKTSSYLDEYTSMYMDSGSADGAYAYKKPDAKAGTVANIYQGVSVQVVAVEGDWACVVFYNSDNNKKAGWAYIENLSSKYPGETVKFGKMAGEDGDLLVGMKPEVEWSSFNFVDTKTKYTLVGEPWCDQPCSAIIFDYQVTSRNGVKKAYGERDVYVNGGEGWEYVGSFEVEDDFAPVRCEIYFEEPTIIKAIASIPVDTSAENFIFRQAIENIYYMLEK